MQSDNSKNATEQPLTLGESFKILVNSANKAQSKGAFELIESYQIVRAIKFLLENVEELKAENKQ